jgi:hypothetical protein
MRPIMSVASVAHIGQDGMKAGFSLLSFPPGVSDGSYQ